MSFKPIPISLLVKICCILIFVVLSVQVFLFNFSITICSVRDYDVQTSSQSNCPCSICEASLNALALKHEDLLLRLKTMESLLQQQERVKELLVSTDSSRPGSLDDNEILRGHRTTSEHDVVPFDSFNLKGIFSMQKPYARNARFGHGAVEMGEIKARALKYINEQIVPPEQHVTESDLVDGIMRVERTTGTYYDLIFSTRTKGVYRRASFFRPFLNPLPLSRPLLTDVSTEVINMIVPLSGRLDRLKAFLDLFITICVPNRYVYLTIAYAGAEGRQELDRMVTSAFSPIGFSRYTVVYTNSTFTRGAVLQSGVRSWKGGNVLMFFCDVDVYFTPMFLERCRLHSAPRRKVYFPIVFSMYNPDIVYAGRVLPRTMQEQLGIHEDLGFWRDFGYGMTCQYRDDFMAVGGFDTTLRGWGLEDIKLYRSFLASNVSVVRAFDRNIFHLYHTKECDLSLPPDQVLSCLQSKVVNEASHKQLGLLAFGPGLFNTSLLDWSKRLRDILIMNPNASPAFLRAKPNSQPSSVRLVVNEKKETLSKVVDYHLELVSWYKKAVLNPVLADKEFKSYMDSIWMLISALEKNIVANLGKVL